MSALLQQQSIETVLPEIEQHPAWVGNVSALIIEKFLKEFSTPYLFVLRAGENKGDYYVTYIDPNGRHSKIVHRPFVITVTSEGWYYENCSAGGPFIDRTIDAVIHSIMHCEEWECVPFVRD